jgi:phosphoglycolate phosphatase-like HAD superfamily hydrolase
VARLILWDVDGTLLESGGATLQVFNRAVELALGRHPGEHGVSFSGGTDPLIARGILASLEVEDSEAAALVPAILGHLETEMAAVEDVIRRRGRVLPGVPEVLERLAAEPGVHQSVLTGNIAPNAAVKLRAFDLDRWLDLDVGAYGSDHHDRNELVPVAVERLRRLRDVEVAPDDVWVVGDTVRDLDCARAGGAHAVLVATGRIPREELAAAGPDYLFDDLADVDAVASLLTGQT